MPGRMEMRMVWSGGTSNHCTIVSFNWFLYQSYNKINWSDESQHVKPAVGAKVSVRNDKVGVISGLFSGPWKSIESRGCHQVRAAYNRI